MVADRLTRALVAAGIPVLGVTVGAEADRATWVIQYAPTATTAQIAAGDALLTTFDPNAPSVLDAERDDRAQQLEGGLVVQAVARALWEEIQKCQVRAGETLLTAQQLRARVRAILKSLLP
jgi:hypothetical protein